MDTQPYCLHHGWIKNADTGQPIARLDITSSGRNGDNVLVFPGRGAITVDNIYDLLDAISLAFHHRNDPSGRCMCGDSTCGECG
jgi:hypothetical protein